MNSVIKDQNGNISSKRIAGFVIGGIGIIMGVSLFAFSLKNGAKDSETAMDIIKTFLYVAGGLLGIGVIEFFAKDKK